MVGDVRGLGLLVGMEIVGSKASKAPSADRAARACRAAFERGLLTAYDGLHGNVFRLTPALTISEELVDLGLEIMDGALRRVQGGREDDGGPVDVSDEAVRPRHGHLRSSSSGRQPSPG